MSRAVIVKDGFDPVPSVAEAVAFSATAVSSVPDGASVLGILVPAGTAPEVLGLGVEALATAGFTGAAGQALVLPTADQLLVAVGIGDLATADPTALRDAGAAFAGAVPKQAELALVLGALGGLGLDEGAQSLVEGAVLSRYAFNPLKTGVDRTALVSLTMVVAEGDVAAASQGAARGEITAAASALARDLANCPPAHLTAVRIAELAEEFSTACGFDVEIFDRDALVELGCGGLIGVNGGSDDAPRMVKMRYTPAGASTGSLTLVGKGIMYDSGGISLKPSDAVHATMKTDMSGAGNVLAAMTALKAMECPTAVTAYLMCTDNMPSGTALKLGDVMTIRGGTTVEVKNTDAEGRLVMADALVLATEEPTDAIIDIATLTGACLLALGTQVGGVLGNNQALVDQLTACADRADEPLWQLPLERRYRKLLDSDVADIKNLGGAPAGAITAALFLAEFVGDVPWAHVDIAGTAQNDAPGLWRTQGGSGFGTRMLIDVAMNFVAP